MTTPPALFRRLPLSLGIAASLLAVFEGYNSIPTAEGVSRATTRTVVLTALSVLVLNFMLTAILIGNV